MKFLKQEKALHDLLMNDNLHVHEICGHLAIHPELYNSCKKLYT